MSKKIEKVNELIKQELGKILLKEIEIPPQVLLTITRVDTSSDLENTNVFISVYPEEKKDEVFNDLRNNIYLMQKTLNRRLRMRPVPKIFFVKEKETARAGKVEELLEELKKEEK